MANYLELINSHLRAYVDTIENLDLRKAINYSLFPGGKRLRPVLLLSLMNDMKVDLLKGINQAIAIEMIHTYSLIHDDLPAMDNDTLRRGQPTLHIKYGEALAILAADSLLTDSFRYFASGDLSVNQKLEIIIKASNNAGANGMVKGQVLDIDASGKDLNIEEIREIHLRKTKDLLNLSIMAGAIIANLDSEKKTILEDFSYFLGLAFQIKDDINDLELDSIQLGKDAKSDIKNNKATYPKVVGLEQSKLLLKDYKEKSLGLIDKILGQNDLYFLVERTL